MALFTNGGKWDVWSLNRVIFLLGFHWRLRDEGVVGFVLSGLLNFLYVVILIFSVGWCGLDHVNFLAWERLAFVLKEDNAVIFLDLAYQSQSSVPDFWRAVINEWDERLEHGLENTSGFEFLLATEFLEQFQRIKPHLWRLVSHALNNFIFQILNSNRRGLAGHDCLSVGFLYQVFKVLLFLLLFLEFKHCVDPTAVEVGEHADWFVALFVLLVVIVDARFFSWDGV
jgi:hypothetical protein